jgi:hypothetical protein
LKQKLLKWLRSFFCFQRLLRLNVIFVISPTDRLPNKTQNLYAQLWSSKVPIHHSLILWAQVEFMVYLFIRHWDNSQFWSSPKPPSLKNVQARFTCPFLHVGVDIGFIEFPDFDWIWLVIVLQRFLCD